MSSPIADAKEIEAQVLQWSPQLRERFAERLLQSVADEETASPTLLEDQIDEIVRRQTHHQIGDGRMSDYRESMSRLDRALMEFRTP